MAVAATATFEQIVPPTDPTDLGFLSGGFVGQGRKYQMVPTGGRAAWRVRFSGGTVRVTSKDPNIAALGDGFAKPLPRNLLTLNSATGSFSDFFILAGQNAGRTVIVAEDARSQNLDTLTISVKTLLHKTFMGHRLLNRVARTDRTDDELADIFRKMKNAYRFQANVLLDQVGKVNELRTANDYTNPINFDEVRQIKGQGPTDFNDDVVKELNRKNLFGMTDFHLVSVCQMHGKLGVTPAFKNVCYVAHTFTKPNFTNEATTFAHELGHAFGLTHDPGHDFKDMMVAGNVTGAQNSFIMTDADIDRINPSGT